MTLVATTALALTIAAPAIPAEFEANPRRLASLTLASGVKAAYVRPAPEARLARLLDAGRAAAETLGDRRSARLLTDAVRDARWKAISDRSEAADWLASRIQSVASDLAFEPRLEADLPVGFPAPTPVLEVELKRFPAYRVATAPTKGRSGAFWTLFRHIQKNDIPMTAPVESTYAGGELRASRMGFLYQNTEVGTAGQDGSVEVIDVPAEWVVSLGCRGNDSRGRIEEARDELLRWIEDRGDLEVDGELRVMGYNSPMVRGDRRYYEVQLPVKTRSQS